MRTFCTEGPVNFYAYDKRLSFLRVNGAIVDQDRSVRRFCAHQ